MPANRFVARFLGTANLIDGVVQEANGLTQFRSGQDIVIPLDGGTLERAGDLAAMFRPQTLSIRGPADPPVDRAARLAGRVEHREFLGSRVRYSVAVGANNLVVDDSHQTGRRTYDIGEEVALYLDCEQVRLVRG